MALNKYLKNKKGFTLIELLIVIAIIAILAAIIFVAIDPARRLAEARNADRWGSTNSILNAYLKYVVDNRGNAPTTTVVGGGAISASNYYMIGSDSANFIDPDDNCSAQTISGTINLGGLDTTDLLVDTYISSIPIDPKGLGDGWADSTSTKYYFRKTGNGRITIGACEAEQSETISVSR